MRRLAVSLALIAAAFAVNAATDDYPLAPANAVATLSGDYTSVTVSWDPVGDVGENGGHVDADQIVYYIFDAFGSFWDPAIAVTAETSFTFDYSGIEGQDFVAYQITAGVGETYSQAASTNIVAIGAPYTLPWTESFTGRAQQQAWVFDQTSSWDVTTSIADDSGSIKSYDSDGGYLRVAPGKKGDTFGIISGKIDLGDALSPLLSFAYMGGANKLEVRASADAGEMTTLKTVNIKQEPSTADWTVVTVPLTDYIATAYIQIELWFEACDNTTKLMLDAISVADDPSSSLPAPLMAHPADSDVISVYSTSGALIYTGPASAICAPGRIPATNCALPSGLYIITGGSKAQKLLIP